MGKTRKKKAREKLAPLSPVSSRFIFVFALSQFSGPVYLGAWNRLGASLCALRARESSAITFTLDTSDAFGRDLFFQDF